MLSQRFLIRVRRLPVTFLIVVYQNLSPIRIFQASPNIYTSADICGRTIGNNDTGGMLTFNSLLLPAQHKLFCRVKIQPDPVESFSTTGNYVLFHFSDFNVGKQCSDTSVTVLDGNGINMEPIEGSSKDVIFSMAKLKQTVCQSYIFRKLGVF